MIYLDTNIFAYAIMNNDYKGIECRKILSKIARKQEKGFTSCITWDELVFIVQKYRGREISLKEGERMLKFPNLEFIKLDKLIINKAQEIMFNYNLKPRDAIHAASAIIYNIREIVSDDSDFDELKEIKRTKINLT